VDDDELERELESAATAMPATAALDALVDSFGLSPFERDVVVLCAGVELDASFGAACAAAHGDPRRTQPTFSLALAALPDAHWSALAPDGPLRRWRLLEAASSHSLTTGPLQIDERVLHYLAGVPSLDERLRGLVETIPQVTLPGSHAALAERTSTLWSHGQPLPVQLCGGDRAARRAVAAAACAELGLGLLAIRAADLPTAPGEREALSRIWEREAVLSGAGLLVECNEHDEHERAGAALALVGDVHGIRLVSTRDTIPSDAGTIVRLDVPPLSEEERIGLWRETLGGEEDGLESVARQFELGVHGIEAAAAQVRLGSTLWESSRAQARPRLDDLAQRIEPVARWEDLVLPEPQRELLGEIATHVRRRATVYDDWGWASRSVHGLGIAALFSGASGTGKTMAGEMLANELELDLYRIDLSSVVSKYIGETEKNLRRVFDAAEEGGAVLLFDEADALFGKRSEVKDSHDRYANIEISYLLQRMESYRGLAILTTNQKNALDPAFLRRLRFVVQFPFPDAHQRAEIWRRIFPAETPTSGLEPELLSRLNVAGGNIRSIALNATFLAADASEPVAMTHLLRAARSEYAKLEKPLGDSEIRGWE
jgi:hypothetical protein